MQTVAVIDYGMGNLRSVSKALEHVGAGRVLITSDAQVIREADRVVFPGVGAIRDCMAEIRRLGDAAKSGIPVVAMTAHALKGRWQRPSNGNGTSFARSSTISLIASS